MGRKSKAKYMKTSSIISNDEQGQSAAQEPESQDKCRKRVRLKVVNISSSPELQWWLGTDLDPVLWARKSA